MEDIFGEMRICHKIPNANPFDLLQMVMTISKFF